MFTNKTGKAQLDKSVLFGKFCVKLLAQFTSKTRKHNFRKACLSTTTCSFPFSRQVVHKPFSTGNLESKTKSANCDRERDTSGQMKESNANLIAQILWPVNLVCLSAPYIAKENWLRAKLLNIPSTKWFFTHVRETSFSVTTFFPSPWTIGNFRASSSVTVFKALPTIQLLVTRLEVYIQPTRPMMSSLQRNDNAKRAMSANWVAVLSEIKSSWRIYM